MLETLFALMFDWQTRYSEERLQEIQPPAPWDVGEVEYEIRPWRFIFCGNRIACSKAAFTPCRVYLWDGLEDSWMRPYIIAHELGHCRGWPANHPGIEDGDKR